MENSKPIPTESIEEDDERTNGLVGLENFGNTCYMNAALQALSNCMQFTELMVLNVPLNRDDLSLALSLAYRNLLIDMWYSKRSQYNTTRKLFHKFSYGIATPSRVLRVLRESHPIFRGFGQHDSQEFIRAFLNDIHEEMKTVPFNDQLVAKMDLSNLPTVTNGEIFQNDVNMQPNFREKSGDISSEPDYKKNEMKQKCFPSYSKTTVTQVQKPPRSIVTDVFEGSLITSIMCLSCGRCSTRHEVFLDLSIPVTESRVNTRQIVNPSNRTCLSPSKTRSISTRVTRRLPSYFTEPATRMIAVGQRVTKRPIEYSLFLAHVAIVYFWFLLNWLQGWIWNPHISLTDCLDSFFDKVELKGDNMYSCVHCKKRCNGVMQFQLLRLPEVLCFHLKRFRHDFMNSSKISSCVNFPLHDLDLTPFLHSSCLDKVVRYDLIGVVCHSGCVRAGHYYSYALNQRKKSWYEFDDTRISPVSDATVASCLTSSAYILFYKKQDKMIVQARNDRNCLNSAIQVAPSTSMVYISRRWLNHFELFAEPGPIDNSDFLCSHGAVQPLLWDKMAEYVECIALDYWKFYVDRFGGGPLVKELNPCVVCTRLIEALQERRKVEKQLYLQECQSQSAMFVISQKWFTSWHNFVIGRQLDPPGPIDNSDVLESATNKCIVLDPSLPTSYRLRHLANYELLNETCWRYLHSIYRGGPEHAVVNFVANGKESPPALLPKAHSLEAQPLMQKDAMLNGWDEATNEEEAISFHQTNNRSFVAASANSTLSSASGASFMEFDLSPEHTALNDEASGTAWEPEECSISENTSNASPLSGLDSPEIPACDLSRPEQMPSCDGDNYDVSAYVHLPFSKNFNMEEEKKDRDFCLYSDPAKMDYNLPLLKSPAVEISGKGDFKRTQRSQSNEKSNSKVDPKPETTTFGII